MSLSTKQLASAIATAVATAEFPETLCNLLVFEGDLGTVANIDELGIHAQPVETNYDPATAALQVVIGNQEFEVIVRRRGPGGLRQPMTLGRRAAERRQLLAEEMTDGCGVRPIPEGCHDCGTELDPDSTCPNCTAAKRAGTRRHFHGEGDPTP